MQNRSQTNARTALKTTDSSTAERALEPVEIHGLLANERRRLVIKQLAEHGPLEFRDLTERVASQLEGRPVNSSDDAYQKYYSALYQTHLDKLADASVIAFERKTGAIRLGECSETVLACMQDVGRSGPGDVSGVVGWVRSLF